jgi:hypothetical protein
MKKILLVLFITIGTKSGVAQSITLGEDNIAFHSSQALNNGNSFNMNNEFIVRGANEIEWSHENGTEKDIYEITGVTGSWTDLNAAGKLEFAVKLANRNGKIVLSRSGSGSIKIRIQMYRGSVDLVPFDFVVSGFEKLN